MARRSSVTWADHVSVAGRYQRSVHLERDALDAAWLDDYLITPLVRSIVERVATGLVTGANAWSLTGPYGTGKSAFALFLSHLFGIPKEPTTKRARRLLRAESATLSKSIFRGKGPLSASSGLVPVRATGERASLEVVLLKALADAAEAFWKGPGAKPDVLWAIVNALSDAAKGKAVGTRRVVELFEEAAEKVAASSRKGRGLVVILDEAGKTLEYAAHHPSHGDVHLLQELAEAANRSGDTPIVFAVLLHQGFEQYASRLSVMQRNEWAKVQGRFEDVAFQEASEQVLRLIGAAVECRQLPSWTKRYTGATLKEVGALGSKDAKEAPKLVELLGGALPLHPVTALSLGPLFRSRFAQNERSLFAFLASNEPGGFKQFLHSERVRGQDATLYAVDALYDYVQTTLGGRFTGHHLRHWAQIDTALRRLPEDATALDARIIKTIGVLSALNDTKELRPSRDVLEAALIEPSVVTKKDVDVALDRLNAASIIVYRRYLDAFQLWEGSDLDLESLVQTAMVQRNETSPVERLRKLAPARPLVARKHLFDTGALRFFEVRYADERLTDAPFDAADTEADGVVWLTIPSNERAGSDLTHRLANKMTWLGHDKSDAKPVLVAVPESAAKLRELAGELIALEWVQTNTPALRDDPVARRELELRHSHARAALTAELSALINGRSPCTWYRRGEKQQTSSAKGLARLLSEVFDEAFASAPIIHNELLNRTQPSSAAAAARRALMTAMLEHPHEERLGIEGFPPELSMYRSLLEVHGLHRSSKSGWGFAKPTSSSSLAGTWSQIQKLLDESEDGRVRVSDVYARLALPPFGVKEGVLPVVVLAAILESRNEVAVYEDNTFVPGLTAPIIERLLRSPDRFELQRFRITGARRALFSRLADALLQDAAADDASVLDVVRNLVRFATKLPEFARYTKGVSPHATKVREALLRAREPAPLLFRDLPKACDLPPLTASRKGERERVEAFVQALRTAMLALQDAYPNLLSEVQQLLVEAFGLANDFAKMRRELVIRSTRLLDAAIDPKLKSFLVRVTDDTLDQEAWLVSIATLLGGKPPAAWRDNDLEQARLTLALIRRRYHALEAVLIDDVGEPLPDGTAIVRISVAQLGAQEAERVVAIREEDGAELSRVKARLREAIQSVRADASPETVLAALGLMSRELMSETSPDNVTISKRPNA